jgi:tRNA A-37 threonylcarbamoyl transferase component Bud32
MKANSDKLLPEIPGYRVLECLGQGGSGSVYLAESTSLRRMEAIKLLHDELPSVVTERLRLDAQQMAGIRNALVAQVYSFGSIPVGKTERHYIAMEYFDGRPLLDLRTKEQFLDLPFGRRVHHFRELCEAVNDLHCQGIVHGDLSAANVMYAARTDRIKIVDFGVRPELERDQTAGDLLAGDVKALSGFFLQYVCVPVISTYRDRLADAARSIEEILCLLENVRRAGPPPVSNGPDLDGGAKREAYGADALARYDEILMRFCCSFRLRTRVIFGIQEDLDRPYSLAADQANRRVHVYLHPLVPYTSADEVIVLDAIARVSVRDAAFRFGAWLRETGRSVEEPLPSNAGFSDLPSASDGLGLKDILQGLVKVFQIPDSPGEVQDETAQNELRAVTVLQLLQAGVLYNKLLQGVRDGEFGRFTPTGASERVLTSWSRRDLLGGMFVQTLGDVAAGLDLEIGSEQRRIVEYVLGNFPSARLSDRHAARKLLEHLLWTLLPEPLISLAVDECFALEPARVFLTADQAGSLHWGGGYLHVLGRDRPKTLSIAFSRDDLITLKALMAFEAIVRAPVTQTFELDRLAIHGRRGIGNILVAGAHYIQPGNRGWEELEQIVDSQGVDRRDRSFEAKMQRLLARYEADLTLDARDGRLFVDDGARDLDHAALQSAGIVPVMNFSGRPAHIFLAEWMNECVARASKHVRGITN